MHKARVVQRLLHGYMMCGLAAILHIAMPRRLSCGNPTGLARWATYESTAPSTKRRSGGSWGDVRHSASRGLASIGSALMGTSSP
jgi:hypothetical protein